MNWYLVTFKFGPVDVDVAVEASTKAHARSSAVAAGNKASPAAGELGTIASRGPITGIRVRALKFSRAAISNVQILGGAPDPEKAACAPFNDREAIVVVENGESIRLIEFGRGKIAEAMQAGREAGAGEPQGRFVVAAKLLELGTLDYLAAQRRRKKRDS
jgi:hypothetical protein